MVRDLFPFAPFLSMYFKQNLVFLFSPGFFVDMGVQIIAPSW